MSMEDEKFLQGVFAKARYLEYLKAEEEAVKENSRRHRMKTINMAANLLMVLIISFILIKVTNFNIAVEICASLGIFSFISFYEYREERRTIYENCNK